ncbi:MAG: YdcF family protein [Oxalobacteraceae bacterium]|jgi:uncharacterized SAM-binding protein YcdF (DUF218 family)|nr:YdcF family protein [Oxalobacteraceae bacterium]
MSFSWFFTNLLAAFLLPPLSLVMLGCLGWWLAKRFRVAGNTLIMTSIALLMILSTSAGSRLLVVPLEHRSLPVPNPRMVDAQAIVILGGGRSFAAPEDGDRDQPGAQTLARLRHGARLHRLTGLPVLVSGGAPDRGGESEAAVMSRALREDFQTPVRWLEDTSENTAQNAARAATLLREAGIDRVLLVTDAIHMPRAMQIFSKTGLVIMPAATDFRSRKPLSAADFIPSAVSLQTSHYALHEWIGMFWYRLRHL